MRIEIPREFERIGAVQIYGLQKIYELDAGPETPAFASDKDGLVRCIPSEDIYEIESEMAIVVPVRNERLKLLEGVLVGIPNPCLVIVVSNSPREPVDRFHLEQETIENICRLTGKKVLVVHQKDPVVAKAFAEAGYTDILDDKGLVRNGKAEGMIMGTLLARMMGRKYLGFVDSDNYFPGAVHEYVREYAAGFRLNEGDHTFVRISWHSKPKIVESELYFAKWGRSSIQSNRILNKLLSCYTGFETEIIKTGNAGEHALTLDLAMNLDYATGYAVESYHFVNIFEKFSGILPDTDANNMSNKVKIAQIESRNPHLHQHKGDEHVEHMIAASLSTVYHTKLCPENLRADIDELLVTRGYQSEDATLAPVRVYPALNKLNLDTFTEIMEEIIPMAPGEFISSVKPELKDQAVM